MGGSEKSRLGYVALVALKRTGCVVRQLEYDVTASVQSDHLLRGYMPPVFFATDQLHHTPHSAEIQPMSQRAADANHPYRGSVCDTRAPASCPKCSSPRPRGLDQDCWPRKQLEAASDSK